MSEAILWLIVGVVGVTLLCGVIALVGWLINHPMVR